MEKRKKFAIGSSIAAVVIIALTYSLTYSFLLDYDTKDNVITIGKVSLQLLEDKYKDSEYVVAHSVVNKNPQIQNDGNKNEYVFMSVKVPKRKVTLLYEDNDTDSEGKKKPNQPGDYEIFKMLVTTENANVGKVSDDVKDLKYVDFNYYKGTDPDKGYKEGWVLLEIPESAEEDDEKYDEYIFGYNHLLEPNDKTTPLFDQVKLKSFIDQEVSGDDTETKVEIEAYGIQSRNLNINMFENDTKNLSKDNLKAIYDIVKNKNNQDNN